MVELLNRPRVGPYILTKRLSPGVLGDRWLALDERDQTSHVVHRFRHPGTREDALRILHAVQQTAALDDAHILKVEGAALDTKGRPFAVTPYIGDSDGVLTLDTLLRRKGGLMPIEEAKRALEHMLGAVQHAHEHALAHGPLSMPEIQVGTRGNLAVELYGVARLLSTNPRPRAEAERLEIRSVFEIAYQMVTGLRVETPIIPACRVLPDLDASWDDLFETGLGEPGFSSAAHALSAVQNCRVTIDSARGGIERMRSTIRKLLFVTG